MAIIVIGKHSEQYVMHALTCVAMAIHFSSYFTFVCNGTGIIFKYAFKNGQANGY